MSDDDLKRAVQRLNLEKQYRELNPQKKSMGKRFVDKVAKDVLIPAATNVAKKALEEYLLDTVGTITGKPTGKKKKTK